MENFLKSLNTQFIKLNVFFFSSGELPDDCSRVPSMLNKSITILNISYNINSVGSIDCMTYSFKKTNLVYNNYNIIQNLIITINYYVIIKKIHHKINVLKMYLFNSSQWGLNISVMPKI